MSHHVIEQARWHWAANIGLNIGPMFVAVADPGTHISLLFARCRCLYTIGAAAVSLRNLLIKN